MYGVNYNKYISAVFVDVCVCTVLIITNTSVQSSSMSVYVPIPNNSEDGKAYSKLAA